MQRLTSSASWQCPNIEIRFTSKEDIEESAQSYLLAGQNTKKIKNSRHTVILLLCH